METLIIFALFIGVMWLLLIRPQRQKQKKHSEMLEDLARGDDVITIGGMHGRVDTIAENYIDLEVTDDLILRFQRQAIAQKVDHTEQAEAAGS
jgi:preprotein translocase subunit YajC